MRCGIEALEGRTLLSAGPQIINTFADNRGQVVLSADADLNGAGINYDSCRMFTAGPDGLFRTADDVRLSPLVQYNADTRQIVMQADLPADTPYRVNIRANMVTGVNMAWLDGEFHGGKVASGDGQAGGNYKFISNPSALKVARFTTITGAMNVQLDPQVAPITVGNFTNYANNGMWDGTFFQRSEKTPLHVLQGGGYTVTSANQVDALGKYDPIVMEQGLSNVAYTIAMARSSDLNSASNQWFFNTADNTNLDTLNGGYSAFGAVAGTPGRAVLDRLAAYRTVNAGGQILGQLPVKDYDTVIARNSYDPQVDSIFVYRVAMKMLLSPVA